MAYMGVSTGYFPQVILFKYKYITDEETKDANFI